MINNVYICGSRSYNLSTQSSDYDIIAIDNSIVPPIEKSHVIHYTSDRYIRDITQFIDAYHVQHLFPYKWIYDTDLKDYITNNREDIVKSNLKNFYNCYMKKAIGFSYELAQFVNRYPKRAVYSCLFYDTIIRYASQDISFYEAFQPAEDFRQWLLSIRKGEIAVNDIIETNEILHKKAIKCEAFYDSIDTEALSKHASNLKEILK